ncbi:hypothetical protein BO71DRAFT_412213 [Aspergillus ellipticus CBS 707.79]|uniref:Uncharacterized protein n=1 Tax=Aspergillus ellipticus CBS 707.79 TaxID=1448320 RepID=A0A319D8R0_9EURO|nr:hypothetical protein BO71DRAFT_412213 [Aspergillus ellipticus CBS 707.79]
MLMHRPASVFATFYTSKAAARKAHQCANSMDMCQSIDISIMSAKRIVELAHDVYFHRYPQLKFDGSLATFLVSACVTLLYDVLDPETTSQYAKQTFHIVEQGIKCIDHIQHIGPTTGKAVSLDIMKAAKDALLSTRSDFLDESLVGDFHWLH